jgi:hypothetical protein
MNTNEQILQERTTKRDQNPGPRVGDFIKLPTVDPRQGDLTRITHHWDDYVQTGWGSFYLTSEGGLSMSGSLDPGVAVEHLIPTHETLPGSCWFFDRDIHRAHNGVNATIPCRVFALEPGTPLYGFGELNCPFSLYVLDQQAHERTCGYWYLIYKKSVSHTAFATREETLRWLGDNQIVPCSEVPEPGEARPVRLQFPNQQTHS